MNFIFKAILLIPIFLILSCKETIKLKEKIKGPGLSKAKMLVDHETNCLRKRSYKSCLKVSTSSENAQKAYTLACENGHAYGCALRGQSLEIQHKYSLAIFHFKKACKLKDKYGCEFLKELHYKLCFDLDIKKYCGLFEPEGNYAFLDFFRTKNEKYLDIFLSHDFSYDFDEKVKKEYQNILKRGDLVLIRALLRAFKKGSQDGDSAGSLTSILGGDILLKFPRRFIKAVITEKIDFNSYKYKVMVIQDSESFSMVECEDLECKKEHLAVFKNKIYFLKNLKMLKNEKVVVDKTVSLIEKHLSSMEKNYNLQ